MMNPEFKEKWLKALRLPPSKGYVQAKGKLAKTDRQTGGDSFCCLGVAANLLIQSGEAGEFHWGGAQVDPYRMDGFGLLPPSLAKKIGLGWTAQNALARMNDNGATFREIADYIEAEL